MSDMRLRRSWPLGALVLLGALLGLAYGLLRPPVYAAKAYVVVVAKDSNDSTAVSYAQAYARIAGQGQVLATAASASNGTATPEELRSSAQASSSPDAPVIEITGSGRSAAHSADVANLVANALADTANRSSTDTKVRLVLLSAAAAPSSPASPRPVLDVAVGAAAGVLLAGLALLGRSGRTDRGGGQPRVPSAETPAGEKPASEKPASSTPVIDGAAPEEIIAPAPDAQRWIGTAPALPRPRPAPNTANRDEQPISKGSGTGGDDDRTDGQASASGSDRSGRNGSRKQRSQRMASRNAAGRNVASRNTERRRGPQ